MTLKQCTTPLSFAEMIDYFQGDLTTTAEERLEAHFFGCISCTRRFEIVENFGHGIKNLAARGRIGGVVNSEFVERAHQTGVTIREYRLAPGLTVSCKAGSEDLVLVRLSGKFASAKELALEVDFHNLEDNQSAPAVTQMVDVDHKMGEIFLVFPGDEVRNYPRSMWKLRAYSVIAGSKTEFGTYCLDHTP